MLGLAQIPVAKDIKTILPVFFHQEADHNQGGKPRIDILVSFTDDTWVRYHPGANCIWSQDTQPTEAMTQRINYGAKLKRKFLVAGDASMRANASTA